MPLRLELARGVAAGTLRPVLEGEAREMYLVGHWHCRYRGDEGAEFLGASGLAPPSSSGEIVDGAGDLFPRFVAGFLHGEETLDAGHGGEMPEELLAAGGFGQLDALGHVDVRAGPEDLVPHDAACWAGGFGGGTGRDHCAGVEKGGFALKEDE